MRRDPVSNKGPAPDGLCAHHAAEEARAAEVPPLEPSVEPSEQELGTPAPEKGDRTELPAEDEPAWPWDDDEPDEGPTADWRARLRGDLERAYPQFREAIFTAPNATKGVKHVCKCGRAAFVRAPDAGVIVRAAQTILTETQGVIGRERADAEAELAAKIERKKLDVASLTDDELNLLLLADDGGEVLLSDQTVDLARRIVAAADEGIDRVPWWES